jgi:hypothetical protein
MPLLDHFHAPLAPRRHWESFHVNWAGAMADALNERLLPEGYFAEEHAQLGARVEIDVATFTEAPAGTAAPGGTTTMLPARVWTPPAPALVIPAAFPDSFEVLVFASEGGTTLVAAIELVSPANKDRGSHRQAFVIKCASYLCRGIGLIIVDIVTSRQANLHNEMMRLLGHDERFALPADTALYAVAYRPMVRDHAEQVEMWTARLQVGQPLPVLPLALNAEVCLPLDLEATYVAACQRRRLA